MDSNETEKIDLEELISSFKVQDKNIFKIYLKEIWADLSQRNNDNECSGISKITFSSYYQLPGLILDRLFNVLDSNKTGYLESSEFISGMTILFCEEFDLTSKFIFDFYDFDKSGKISKEDIRTVLSYVSLSQEIQNYKDRVHSQEELYNILEKCFSKIKGEKMVYEQFKNVIENENSDIYLMILLFLYEKKPFTKATLSAYMKKSKKSPLNSPPKSPSKIIASPSKNSSFSPYNYFRRDKKRTNTLKQELSIMSQDLLNSPLLRRTRSRHSTVNNKDIIKLVPTPSTTKHSKFTHFDYNESLIGDEHYSPIHRKDKINLKNLGKENQELKNKNDKNENIINFTEAASQPVFKQVKNDGNNNNNKDSESCSLLSGDLNDIKKGKEKDKDIDLQFNDYDEENSEEEEEKETIKNEGYLIKFVDNKVKRVFFKLVGKDLFYFKNKNQDIHKGMHNLSGVFINEEEPKEINGKKYYCFSVTYPKKSRIYYVEKENEYKIWIEKLKIATGFTNLTDIYDIGEKIGNGKFGLIKKGTNKKTGMQVAIKIMSKKDMTNQDLELVRTEIEILKICQHPNIIKLYDIFENENYYYIIMEYCSGGDLFSFLERHQFKLKEELASKIMHKICAAIYYIHSYGICHRDLKPENILMTSKNENSDIRLLDFGLSKIIGPNETCNEPYGTLTYCAPEILLDNPYTKQVDLWSLGVMTYLMLTGKLPFYDRIDREIAKKAAFSEPDYSDKLWNGISDDAINFVKGLLKKKGDERMNIKEALQHNWIKKFCDDDIFESRNKCKENASKEFQVYSSVKDGKI